MRNRSLLTLSFLIGSLLSVNAQVRVIHETYHGWKGCVRLTNGTVELVVVPSIARIMRYSYVGGKNLLWENPALVGKPPPASTRDWINWGGDKLWNSPQDRWGWPPDRALDQEACTVKVLPDKSLLVIGATSAKSGIHFTRKITMKPKGTEVTIVNTMTASETGAVEWGVWEVAQMDSPDQLRLPLNKSGKFPMGYLVFKNSEPAPGSTKLTTTDVLYHRDLKKSSKIGSDSPKGYLIGEKDSIRFTLKQQVTAGANYPDDGCALEMYSSPDPTKYMELELMGPVEWVQPSESLIMITHWKLERIKK